MSRRLVLSAAAAAVILIADPARGASWGPVQTLSPSAGTPSELALLAGGDGRLLGTWWTRSGRTGAVQAAVRGTDGTWQAAGPLGPAVISAPAALPNGRVLAVSGGDPGTDHRVRAWTGDLSRRPLRAVTIGRGNWDLPVVDTDATGRAIVAWTWEQPRRNAGNNLRPRVVVVCTRSAGGRWSRPRRVSPLPPAPPYGRGRGPVLSATSVTVALGGRGVAVVAWQREGRIEARISRDAGRNFGKVTRLGRTSFPHPRPSTDVSRIGSYAVGWSTAWPAGRAARTLRSYLAVRAPGGGFGRPFELGAGTLSLQALAPGADQFGARVLVRYRPDGRGLVAWQSAEGGRVGVRLARFTPTGAAPGAVQLPPADALAARLDDLVTGHRLSAVGWSIVGGDGAPAGVRAAVWPANGELGAPEDVASGSATDIRLATTTDDLVAMWLSGTPRRAVVTATRRP